MRPSINRPSYVLIATTLLLGACADEGDTRREGADAGADADEGAAFEAASAEQALLATHTVGSLRALASSVTHGLAASSAIPLTEGQERRFGGRRGAGSKDVGDCVAPGADEGATPVEAAVSSLAASTCEGPYGDCTVVDTTPTGATITYACEGDAYAVDVTGVIVAEIAVETSAGRPPTVAAYTADAAFQDLTVGGVPVEGGMVVRYDVESQAAAVALDATLTTRFGDLGVTASLEVEPEDSCPTVAGEFELTAADGQAVTVEAHYDACGPDGCPSAGGSISTTPQAPRDEPATRVDFDGSNRASVRDGEREGSIPLACGAGAGTRE